MCYYVTLIFEKANSLNQALPINQQQYSMSDAKLRACYAALQCIKTIGFERTTMSDIAKQAGIARPTLYKHFKHKLDAFFTAIDQVALDFTEDVVAHARQFTSFEERVIETIVYVVTKLPKHEYLSLILDNECALALKERAFADEATLVFAQMTAEPLIELRPDLAEQSTDITEFMSRFAIAMILFPGKYQTDTQGLREMIKVRILPGLG